MTYEKKRVLLTVKAYPEKSHKYGACVCTAGITDKGEFVRLYPIPFENFRGGKTLRKYSWINVDCEKASEYLERKESYKVRYSTINVESELSTGPNRTWEVRNKVVLPLVSKSLESLQQMTDMDHTSLGLIKPKEITDFTIDSKAGSTDEEEILKEVQTQMTLEGEARTDLEDIGYNFRYHFYCMGENCKGHNIMCEDWEMLESWRKWKRRYRDRETFVERFRQTYLDRMRDKNLHFFVGTHSRFNTWLIIGLYYPPKSN